MARAPKLPITIKRVASTMMNVGDCIIAGGAIRDTLNNRPVKDIDVFIDARYKHAWNQWCNHGRRLGKNDQYAVSAMVDDVYELPAGLSALGYDSLPIQLIFLRCAPTEYVSDYFDFGICKTWYDGNHIHCHKDYLHDINNKAITMGLDDNTFKMAYPRRQYALAQMLGHALRIKSKYPDHQLSMPEF